MTDMVQVIVSVWRNDDRDTLFKMGEKVLLEGNGEMKIIGVNRQDESTVEYALDNWPFLIWEEQLAKIPEE